MRRITIAITAVLTATGAACDYKTEPSVVFCTTDARAAVSVNVVDSLTGIAGSFTGVWARAVDGSYRDSTAGFTPPPGGTTFSVGLAYERAGNYTVTAHADGYKDWTQSGVVVTSGQCHVNGVIVTARLVK